MSVNAIQGKDVNISFERGGVLLPYACATECSISMTTELIRRTSVAAGAHAKYKARMMDATASLSGVTYIIPDVPGWTVFDLAKDAVRMNGLNMQLEFSDRAGNYKRISGYVLFPTISIEAGADGFSQDSIDMQFSGVPGVFNEPPPESTTPNNVTWNYYVGTGGELGFTDTNLIGATKVAVFRASGWLKPITSGSPGVGQFKLNSGTGQVTWFGGLDAGEIIFYQWQEV